MRLSRWRVRVGFVLGALALWLAAPTPATIAWGVPLALLGEVVRLWASGHIEKTQALATGGPYAHTRNPLYVGSLLMTLGLALSSASVWTVLAVAVYWLVFYPPVIREESAFLAAKFPEHYAAWAPHVPAFLPRLTPSGPRASRFSWARVRLNREGRTCAALPLIVLLLLARGALR